MTDALINNFGFARANLGKNEGAHISYLISIRGGFFFWIPRCGGVAKVCHAEPLVTNLFSTPIPHNPIDVH